MNRVATVFLSIVLMSAIGCRQPPNRVLILGLDGLDPQTIDLLMSEGKMPNFARLRQEGAYGRLESQEPLLSPVVWTTVATGKSPSQHGIGHFVALDPQTGESLPVTSAMRRVDAIWNIVSRANRRVAVVGWWATWPPEEVNGSIVSDHTAYHFLFEDGFDADHSPDSGSNSTYPEELAEQISPLLKRPHQIGFDEVSRFVDVPAEELDQALDIQNDLSHFRWALATADSYRDIGLQLWQDSKHEPELGMVYIEGTDSTSHLFGHLFRAGELAGELAIQQQRYGRAVEEIYLYADEVVGQYLAALDDHTTLIVMSDHGFELGALHDDPTRAQSMRRVSERFHRLHGILYMFGHQIETHARLDNPSILDITPTVLALLGIPPAEDMPGRVLIEALEDSVDGTTRVATHERGQRPSNTSPQDPQTDELMLDRLRSLGYLDSPQGDRNLAAIHFQEGRYQEAVNIYRQLLESDPADGSLRTSLAGALGALGQYEQALQELGIAIEQAPLSAEAYHNRAVIHERRGDAQAAIEDYGRATRYQPDYQPSRRALQRLVGREDIHGPNSRAEQEAAALAEEASSAARRGAYPEAIQLLDRALEIAPNYALVYQYRSNVFYLAGDFDASIDALEQGLRIEPDNALFAQNLARIQAQRSQQSSRRPDS